VPTQVVHVDINGQRYSVRSELDPQYIGELAAFIDERVQLAARELTSGDPLRLIIIAALNVADELFQSRTDSDGVDSHMTERAEALERLIDTALADPQAKVVNG
jgi:cell division protein ZapA